ncbi:hypothetical protein E1265_14410 [Streptomyces sp. 8K308]|uniref:hypothetical protein n=1 Tax=Streptomyces sp. 8K308 TaxID=2530388 RepID=UPI0010481146|nr:hypothetical protein [Streptomyces sp. 8K308]TDC22916.1 hypothetical protein E1265_14410 [Streptomyces sp. 8K308]
MSMMKKLSNGIPAACLAATALVAGTMALAAPAHATAHDCQQYLSNRGYSLTATRVNACATGSGGSWVDYGLCLVRLTDSGVTQSHAENACDLADN